MRIAWVIPCRSVDRLIDGSYVLMGVITDAYGPSELPATVVVPLMACLTAAYHEAGQPHQLTAMVTGPDMEPRGDPLITSIAPTPGPSALPGWTGHVLFSVNAVLLAGEYGPYSFDLRLDDQPPHSTPIFIRPPAGAPTPEE